MSVLGRVADRVLGPRVPPWEVPYPLPPGVVLRRNRLIPAVSGWFMGGRRRPAAAVTLGRTILVNVRQRITDDLVVHELVHVEQWRDPLFAVKYVAGWIRYGYRLNPYEREAYARQRAYARRRKTAPPRNL
ncbi:MAG TPA: hypothetical protein VF142_07910 [Longimicrobium sp.]